MSIAATLIASVFIKRSSLIGVILLGVFFYFNELLLLVLSFTVRYELEYSGCSMISLEYKSFLFYRILVRIFDIF